jgi:hypothetical protein
MFQPCLFAINGWDKVKKCANLLNMSMTTKIVSLPWEVSNPSTNSRVISSQTWYGMDKGQDSNRGKCVYLYFLAYFTTLDILLDSLVHFRLVKLMS